MKLYTRHLEKYISGVLGEVLKYIFVVFEHNWEKEISKNALTLIRKLNGVGGVGGVTNIVN